MSILMFCWSASSTSQQCCINCVWVLLLDTKPWWLVLMKIWFSIWCIRYDFMTLSKTFETFVVRLIGLSFAGFIIYPSLCNGVTYARLTISGSVPSSRFFLQIIISGTFINSLVLSRILLVCYLDRPLSFSSDSWLHLRCLVH